MTVLRDFSIFSNGGTNLQYSELKFTSFIYGTLHKNILESLIVRENIILTVQPRYLLIIIIISILMSLIRY
jgi:hypothetical protein